MLSTENQTLSLPLMMMPIHGLSFSLDIEDETLLLLMYVETVDHLITSLPIALLLVVTVVNRKDILLSIALNNYLDEPLVAFVMEMTTCIETAPTMFVILAE